MSEIFIKFSTMAKAKKAYKTILDSENIDPIIKIFFEFEGEIPTLSNDPIFSTIDIKFDVIFQKWVFRLHEDEQYKYISNQLKISHKLPIYIQLNLRNE